MQLERNLRRSLPCSFCSSAFAEHSLETLVRPVFGVTWALAPAVKATLRQLRRGRLRERRYA